MGLPVSGSIKLGFEHSLNHNSSYLLNKKMGEWGTGMTEGNLLCKGTWCFKGLLSSRVGNLLFCSFVLCSFALSLKISHFKERPWAIHSRSSLQKNSRERIAPITLSLTKNKQIVRKTDEQIPNPAVKPLTGDKLGADGYISVLFLLLKSCQSCFRTVEGLLEACQSCFRTVEGLLEACQSCFWTVEGLLEAC